MTDDPNPKSKIQNPKSIIVPAFIVLLGVTYKLVLLAMNAVPFNGDEGTVALMARHVLQGERPVFFYGQAYLGSTDAWLVALSFAIFGESVLAIRIAQIALFAGILVTAYLVAKRFGLSEWGARVALLWLALPPPMLTLYTTATLGGYGETLLFGNILLLMAFSLLPGVRRASNWRWLLLGIISGFAFFTFPLILVYLIPIALWLLYRLRLKAWRGYLVALAGVVIGSAPWWWALIQAGGAPIAELAGAGVAGTIPGATYFDTVGVRFINFFLFGAAAWLGLRYPWSAGFVLPLVGIFVFTFYLGALGYAVRRGPRVLWGMLATLFVTYLITPFGGDPSGRYYLPLYLPLAIFTAMLLQRFRKQNVTLAVLLTALLLGYNGVGTMVAAAQNPPGITTQFDPATWIDHARDRELIDFLLENGETRGYTNYWVQTPIAFLSNEQIIGAARLPYHLDLSYTARDDRYAPYTQTVRESPRAFYITTNHPRLDALIRDGLTAAGVTFKEQEIGNYHIFYALSRKVTPEELGIGEKVTR